MTITVLGASVWTYSFWSIVGAAGIVLFFLGAPLCVADDSRFTQLTNDEAWARIPAPTAGSGQPLPAWARTLAAELPRTTAAYLQLDFAHRSRSPIPAKLRAAMRWMAADVNRCMYAKAYAEADAVRAGVDSAALDRLRKGDYSAWTEGEQQALSFARKMSADSDGVTDAEFASLVQHFGEKQVASMVLLLAYANFQDRLLICLGTQVESGGPYPPVDVAFPPEAFVVATTPPPLRNPQQETAAKHKETTGDLIEDDAEWKRITYDVLQARLETQRQKPTRLRIPAWDEVSRNLPEGLMKKPSDIIWYRIVFGYAPELAVPFEIVMRTAGAEAGAKWDRIFGQGLFWVTTKAVKCPYCMGHCEMNWEVAGLKDSEIAERSLILAGDDWSQFPASEQHAFAFARKLSVSPWEIRDKDIQELKKDFGVDRAFLVVFNASRYHYMTRISNGFQLTLERENVFYDYYNVKSNPLQKQTQFEPAFVPVLTNEEAWKRLPDRMPANDTAAENRQPLPIWARAIAARLPRTAAAMLQLDFAQRTKNPLDPILRSKMRWVVARANHCNYSEQYAIADLKRAGASAAVIESLQGDPLKWDPSDLAPMEFARLLTVAAPTIPDSLFAQLRSTYGDKQVAAMVLLGAYGNFQDRIILGLNLQMEDDGPLAPLAIPFDEKAFQIAPFVPPQANLSANADQNETVVAPDPEWSVVPYEQLQARLEQQRGRTPRLPIPAWEDVRKNIPAAMAVRPTRIVWNLVCSGYVPELAVPWSISTRTLWAESHQDRVFEESLFWIQTRAISCNYCMGHCEMLLEVAGLGKEAIAERTKRLASNDWSAFPPAEQRAFAYARKLSRAPWTLTRSDFQTLEADLGAENAMAIFWWLCRGLYMTRVSDGFQLPLERENVFQSLPGR